MYRIILITENSDFETKIDQLLVARLRGQYLMKTLSSPAEAVPLINGEPPNVILTEIPTAPDALESFVKDVTRFAGRIPFVTIVDVADEEEEIRLFQAGSQDCLVLSDLTARALARAIRGSVERSKVERKLELEQEMLATLLAKLPDRVYFKDQESRFLRVNDAMARLFRLRDPSEAVGRTDHDFFTPEHAQPALRDEQRIVRTGEPLIDKLEKETLPDGSIGWVLTSKLPMRNRSGQIVGTFGISHDVTAMKKLEEAVEAERKRLQVLSEELQAKNIQLEHDLVMAKGIQEALLPTRHYVFPARSIAGQSRVECSSVYRPAKAVGGDFFSMVPISDSQVGILICDIMGHGLRAALGTAIVRGLVEELREHAAHPADFLTRLNFSLRAILRNIDEPLLVTACYLVVSAENDEILFSSAGHPTPIIIDRLTAHVSQMGERRRAHGPALALFDDATYGMETAHLSEHEMALLFTDGATEMSDADGNEIGIDRFMSAASALSGLAGAQLCERLLDDIQLEAGGAAFEDDVCVLAIERRPPDSQPG
jgi:phosphoserine phosphatase RsbU/P